MIVTIVPSEKILKIKLNEINKIANCKNIWIDDFKLKLSSNSILVLEAKKVLLSKLENDVFKTCNITTEKRFTLDFNTQTRPKPKKQTNKQTEKKEREGELWE